MPVGSVECTFDGPSSSPPVFMCPGEGTPVFIVDPKRQGHPCSVSSMEVSYIHVGYSPIAN